MDKKEKKRPSAAPITLAQVLQLSALPKLAIRQSVPKIELLQQKSNTIRDAVQKRLCAELGGRLIHEIRTHGARTGVVEYVIQVYGETERDKITNSELLRLAVDIFPVSTELTQVVETHLMTTTLLARDLCGVAQFVLDNFSEHAEEFLNEVIKDEDGVITDIYDLIKLILSVLQKLKTKELDAEEGGE